MAHADVLVISGCGGEPGRLEHCMGVAHLAHMLADRIYNLQRGELDITRSDVKCAEVAGAGANASLYCLFRGRGPRHHDAYCAYAQGWCMTWGTGHTATSLTAS